jgi:hypothetical protein
MPGHNRSARRQHLKKEYEATAAEAATKAAAATKDVKETQLDVFDELTGRFMSSEQADKIGEEGYPCRFKILGTLEIYHPNKNTFKNSVEEPAKKQVKDPVKETAQKLPQVISKNLEAPEPQNEFAEYPDGVVPGFWIPLMFMLGFLAVVTKKEKMSVSNFIDQITEMVGYPVQVYSIGGKRYIIVFQSLQDVFDAVNTSYRTQQHSKIKIRKYQSDLFREDTRCFPLFHPEDPIFQKNKRKMKTIPEEVEASSNSFAALPF